MCYHLGPYIHTEQEWGDRQDETMNVECRIAPTMLKNFLREASNTSQAFYEVHRVDNLFVKLL